MAYIGNSPENVLQARTAEYEYTATAGQTAFSGVDNNGLSLDLLLANQNEVYLNGSRLVSDDDFTVSGDTLTLTVAAAAGDILVIKTQTEVSNIASYTKAEADSRYVNYSGDIINGDLQVVGNVSLGDNNKINLGGSSDLRIFHDGSDGFITNDTGQLILRVASVESALVAVPNGAVSLYHDNSPKLSTTSTGIDVTGRVNTVGITSNDNSHVFTSHSYNVIDLVSDNNDDGSNDDIIVNFRNGSAGTIKAELRWDESSDTFEISRADNRGDFVISANGNVGIGTSSPNISNVGNAVTVNSTSSTIFELAKNGSRVANFYSDGATASLTNNTNNPLTFLTNNTERMQIDKDGFVGIGTTPSDWRTQFDDNALDIGNHSAIYDQWGGATFIANNFYRENNNALIYKTTNDASYIALDGGNITFYNAPNGTAGTAATFSERMRINSNGRVGIGTTNPTGSVHITKKDSNGADVHMLVQNTTANRLAGYQIADENGSLSLEMQYDNGGNGASIRNPNNGALSIYLGGTGSANALDDYEEGTWTPTFNSFGSGSVYSVQYGYYRKIGQLVVASCYIQMSTNTGSGSILVTGLPFASASVTNNYGSTSAVHGTSWSTPTPGLQGLVSSGSTSVQFYRNMSTNSSPSNYIVNMPALGIGNLLFNVTYFTS